MHRHRRTVGLLVLLLAAVGVIAVPSATGRRTAGQPVRTAEPIVGDCVRAVGPWGVAGSGPGTVHADADADAGADADRPTGILVACTEPGAASVIARTSTLDIPARMDLRPDTAVTQPCRSRLSDLVDRWQGGVFRWTRPGTSLVMQAQFMVSARLVEPTREAVARGERWTACVLTGIDGHTGETSPGLAPKPSWGLCFTEIGDVGTASGSRRSVTPCAQPHTEQWIGAGTGAGYPNHEVIGDSLGVCRAFLMQATGLQDVTAGGALEVFAQAQEYGGVGACGLRVTGAQRTLSGSLIGIAGGPVPWT